MQVYSYGKIAQKRIQLGTIRNKKCDTISCGCYFMTTKINKTKGKSKEVMNGFEAQC